MKRKDLLGIQDLDHEEILDILDTAETLQEISTRPIKKVPTLRGKTVINLFFEASTRTQTPPAPAKQARPSAARKRKRSVRPKE